MSFEGAESHPGAAHYPPALLRHASPLADASKVPAAQPWTHVAHDRPGGTPAAWPVHERPEHHARERVSGPPAVIVVGSVCQQQWGASAAMGVQHSPCAQRVGAVVNDQRGASRGGCVVEAPRRPVETCRVWCVWTRGWLAGTPP